jgi:hypothetical protein
MMTLANFQKRVIIFDNGHISHTGKKIPLDVETNEPHDCPTRDISTQQQTQLVQQPQQQKGYHTCNKGCGQEIYFDANNESQRGKYIPLDKDTELPHQCPQ